MYPYNVSYSSCKRSLESEVIDALHAVADARKHLVGDGVELVGEHGDGQMVAEDLHTVSLATGDVGHIDHADVHADVAHIVGALPIDEAVAVAVAQMAVETVGIAYRDSSNDAIAIDERMAAVADTRTGRHMAKLEDGGLQRRDIVEDVVRARIDTIEANAETAHVELAVAEMVDARGVVDMTDDMVGEGGLQLAAAHIKLLKLLAGEIVKLVGIGTDKVAEDATGDDSRLGLEAGNQLVHVLQRIESKPTHAGIELDVDGIARDALAAGSLDKGVEETEGIDLGLQVVVEHRLEGGHLGVHHHDVARDAIAAQRHALVGHGHGQVIDAVVLERLGHLHGTRSIGVGLDHADEFRAGSHHGAVVVEIIDQRLEINLQGGLVDLADKQLGKALETKLACAFEQDHLVAERAEGGTMDEVFDGRVKLLLGQLGEGGMVGGNGRTDTDKALHATLADEGGHLCVEGVFVLAALENIAEDERALATLVVGAATHEVEGNVEGVDVGVVGVVDERAAVVAFLHLQTHGNWLKVGHTVGKLLGGEAESQRGDGYGEGVFE